MKGITARLKIGRGAQATFDISIEPQLLRSEHVTAYIPLGIVFSVDKREINGLSLCIYPLGLHVHWSTTRESNKSSVQAFHQG